MTWQLNIHKLFTVCTEQVRSPYIEHAASRLPNPTPMNLWKRTSANSVNTGEGGVWSGSTQSSCEPQHDKTNNMADVLIKDSDQPGHSLCAQWEARDLTLLHADSEVSDRHTSYFVRCVMLRRNWITNSAKNQTEKVIAYGFHVALNNILLIILGLNIMQLSFCSWMFCIRMH